MTCFPSVTLVKRWQTCHCMLFMGFLDPKKDVVGGGFQPKDCYISVSIKRWLGSKQRWIIFCLQVVIGTTDDQYSVLSVSLVDPNRRYAGRHSLRDAYC